MTHLDNLHVQQPQEATSEAESHGVVDFGLILEGGIVQLELPQGLAKILRCQTSRK